MPLRQQLQSPRGAVSWDEFLSAWVHAIVRHLTQRRLPQGFRAEPHVRLSAPEAGEGVLVRPEDSAGPTHRSAEGAVTATPGPELARTFAAGLWSGDVFEVRIYDEHQGQRLAATVQLVGPGNKDRPEQRDTFVREAAGLLHQGVALLIVDVVTGRSCDLDAELQQLLGLAGAPAVGVPHLYAAVYRPQKVKARLRLNRWSQDLVRGRPLPSAPLSLTADASVQLDLETTYEEACALLQIA